MADFLASLNLAPEPAAPSNSRGCASVEELQTHLRNLVVANVTPTRASHVSTALQLRDTARFELNLSETENDSLVGLNNLDPALDGSRSTPAIGDGSELGQAVRVVGAAETLMNQPHSDPVLQKAVAKHIVAAVGGADASSWAIREVSRQGQAWTFTYQCKDSVQQWARQNAKAPEKPLIGEWYHKEPNPMLDNRPAFDCRGTLTVAFPRNGRSISVKYEHTPVHQTVGQLKDRFKPPPRPEPPKKTVESKTPKSAKAKTPKEPKEPKTPKTPKAPKTPKTPKTGKDGEPKAKKKRPLTAGEGSKPRKRQKKNDGEAQPADDESSIFVDNNHPNFDTPQTGASNAGSESASQATEQAAASAAAHSMASFPNVTAAEAARRKDAATKILSEAGVPPATLSAEQFSIFANQSPELQKDSLAMLVKYGAERLRIVQPTSGAGQQATPPSTQPSANGAVTTKELVPQHRNSLPDTSESREQQAAANGKKGGDKVKLGKSRLVCYQCKERRTKCSKDRPTCEECVKQARSCEYPPQPVRARRMKSEAIVVQSDNDDDDGDEDEPDNQQAPVDEAHAAQSWQMPLANVLGPNVEPTVHNPQPEPASYYQSATGVPLQHLEDSHTRTDMSAASGLTLLQNHVYAPGGNPLHQPMNSSQGIDPMAVQKGRNSRASVHAKGSPAPAVAGTTTNSSNDYPYQPSANQANMQPGHRRTASGAARAQSQQAASPRIIAAAQAQARASPTQQAEQARARSRQGQHSQSRTPVGNGAGIGSVPAAPGQASNLHNARDTSHNARFGGREGGNSVNDGAADHIPYQPYSQNNAARHRSNYDNNAAMSLPTTMPATTASSYSTLPASSQWSRAHTQQSADSYSHSSNTRGSNDFSLRGASHNGPASQPQQTQRDYQDFSSQQQQQQQQQQPPQTSQQTGNSQQNNWFGVNSANSGGSYGFSGQYWS